MRLIDADALEKLLRDAITIQEHVAITLGIEDDEGVQMELKAYKDILNGVKEQPTFTPRVMTLEEVRQNEKYRLNTDGSYRPMILEYREQKEYQHGGWVWSSGPESDETYGKEWRCWTDGFTMEQSKAVKWE